MSQKAFEGERPGLHEGSRICSGFEDFAYPILLAWGLELRSQSKVFQLDFRFWCWTHYVQEQPDILTQHKARCSNNGALATGQFRVTLTQSETFTLLSSPHATPSFRAFIPTSSLRSQPQGVVIIFLPEKSSFLESKSSTQTRHERKDAIQAAVDFPGSLPAKSRIFLFTCFLCELTNGSSTSRTQTTVSYSSPTTSTCLRKLLTLAKAQKGLALHLCLGYDASIGVQLNALNPKPLTLGFIRSFSAGLSQNFYGQLTSRRSLAWPGTA